MALLSDVLDREFRRLSSDPAQFNTGLAQAEKLEISGPQLSRYKNGKYRLSPKTARKWADLLRRDGVQAEKDKLVHELLEASNLVYRGHHEGTSVVETPSVSIRQAKELFSRLSRPDCMLCVMYGDMPRARYSQKYAELGRLAGQAVASGLCFALFQPFPEVPPAAERKLTTDIRNYLRSHQECVRAVYREMLGIAQKEAGQSNDVSRQIVLYERIPLSDEALDPSPLVQSRVFYCEYPGSDSDRPEQEVWEWVSAMGEDDVFVRRWPESIPGSLAYDLHQPVTGFFRKNHRLPATRDELNQAYQDWRNHPRNPLPDVTPVWEISRADEGVK